MFGGPPPTACGCCHHKLLPLESVDRPLRRVSLPHAERRPGRIIHPTGTDNLKGNIMTLLRDKDRRQLTDIFSRQLQDSVTLDFFTQKSGSVSTASHECHTCREAGQLLEEVAALSDKIQLLVHDFLDQSEDAQRLGVDKIPGLVLKGRSKGVLRYFGVPAGYEFGALVEDLVDLSRGATPLSAAARQGLSELRAPVHIKVLVTPT